MQLVCITSQRFYSLHCVAEEYDTRLLRTIVKLLQYSAYCIIKQQIPSSLTTAAAVCSNGFIKL